MRTSLSLILFLLFSVAKLQALTGILYTYDASGNRVKREPAPQQQGRKAAPDTEEKKEVVSKNNIQASFTPNPTVSGNFAVVVSKKDFAANEKNDVTDKPQIFIYNPLIPQYKHNSQGKKINLFPAIFVFK